MSKNKDIKFKNGNVIRGHSPVEAVSEKIESLIGMDSYNKEMFKVSMDETESNEPKLKQVFGKKRIVGLAGNKSSGKTNNLIHLITDFRKYNEKVKIFSYGLPMELKPVQKKLKIKEISSIKQLINKKDCILIIDEFQKLKLNDRRKKDILDEFIDFVYHRNVYVIFSSPNIREFNNVIGGVIEKWILKSVRKDQCINGSQLKNVIEDYKGKYKLLGSIDVPVDEILIINDDEETLIHCDYEKDADNKRDQQEIF